MLVLSFDTNFDIVAAGKLWLSTSLAGARGHLNNPALVGSMYMSPRDRKLEVAVQSRPKPYMEDNKQLQTIFNQGKVRFSFRMAPGLVDYFLEEVSYTDSMLDDAVTLAFLGSYRVAIFRGAVLVRTDLAASGGVNKEMQVGPGGFKLNGNVRLALGYGGLVSQAGVLAYAYLDAAVAFQVEAWIEIGFSKSVKICGKRFSISWTVTFRSRAPRLELSMLGHVGLNDRGLIGVDLAVGIDFAICKYRLKASGRWSHRPEIYDDVRGQVAAFEDGLNRFIQEHQRSLRASRNGVPAARSPAALTLGDLQAAVRSALAAAPPPAQEPWFHYQRTPTPVQAAHNGHLASGSTSHVLLPAPGPNSQWLTPRFAQILSIKTKGDATLELTVKNHGLPSPLVLVTGTRIGIVGLEPLTGLGDLNGLWDLVAEPRFSVPDATVTFTLGRAGASLAAGTYTSIFFGTIYLASVAQPEEGVEVPHLIEDVERIAIRIGDQVPVASATFDGAHTITVTTSGPHGLATDQRVILLDEHQEIYDYGAGRTPGLSARNVADVYEASPGESAMTTTSSMTCSRRTPSLTPT